VLRHPLAVALTLLAAPALAADKPNIVLIFADDHAYQAISAYGDPRKLIEPRTSTDWRKRECGSTGRWYRTPSADRAGPRGAEAATPPPVGPMSGLSPVTSPR
jgi:hypothetical protein